MTTLLDLPARAPAGGRRAPLHVRITETPLPRHEPLALYTALRDRLGDDQAYLLESLESPEQDGSSAVVGYGRLAEIRIHSDRVAVIGAGPIGAALREAAGELGLRPGPSGDLLLGPAHEGDRVEDLLRAASGLFDVSASRGRDEFVFGFMATVGYGAAWHLEELPTRTAESGPDLVLTLFRDTVCYDHLTGEPVLLTADSEAFPAGAGPDLVPLIGALPPEYGPGPVPAAPPPRSVHDSGDEETFVDQVEQCLRHIGVGDIYQIQIGHRIDVSTALSPPDVYRRLRHRNPSPYMYVVPRAGSTLIGASPEVLFRTEGSGDGEGDRVVMHPIAGTTPRSGDPAVDGPRVEELLASEKERAEHVMLVDLCRNDIGRICVPGTLATERLMRVETFSHVFHLVSTVEGTPAPGEDTWSVLRATFPAGTVTGAPKIRAMELIEELESEPRGMYAGAVGLVDVRGWSRLALCIRTITYDGTTYSTQSSAGIVADSQPRAEWRETLHKMGATYWALTGEELLP